MKFRFIPLLLAAFVLSGFGFAPAAHANPSYIATGTTTNSVASSSPVYMGIGTATSTLTYDSYAAKVQSNSFKADAAILAIQFAGSSTATTLNINEEYSNDGIDWYKNYLVDPFNFSATTTLITIGSSNTLSWKFASSTTGGKALTNANSATSTGVFNLSTPMRFVRVILSMAGGGGAVWGQILPIKEQY